MDEQPREVDTSSPPRQLSATPSAAARNSGNRPPRWKFFKRIVLAVVLLVLLVGAAILMARHDQGRKKAVVANTTTNAVPTGVQLAALLPKRAQLPAGWTYQSPANSGKTYLYAGGPPIQLAQCSFIGGLTATGIIIAQRTELSYATETDTQIATSGNLQGLPTGTLTMGFAEFKPGGAAAVISTVRGWVTACPTWNEQNLGIEYEGSVSAVPGLGQQNLDVHAIPKNPTGYTTELLIVRTSSSKLVMVTSTIQAGGTPLNLSHVAAQLSSTFK
jgi:hypothetical protein